MTELLRAPDVGMGCMRLSTERDRDDERSLAVLHAALDAGVTFFDTADAYGHDASDAGHNERLIARALASWTGDRSRVRIATKGGLTRPEGRWVADGRARHLLKACEGSLRALGVTKIELYQLHAPDPRTSFATSVRALAALQRDSLVERVGLSNVNVEQIEEAQRLVRVDAVQVELSLWRRDALVGGVVEHCVAHAIPVIAYRPLGGRDGRRRALADPVLSELAARDAVSVFDVALAWLLDLSPLVIPIPGPTRVETAGTLRRALGIQLTEADRVRLEERFPGARRLHEPLGRRPGKPRASNGGEAEAEVVLVMGIAGAGKSTLAQGYVAKGYARLNRDVAGGRLADLLPELDRLLASGRRRVVLDNTYLTRASRAPVIETAARHGVPVRCVQLETALEDAQFNAAWRMVSRYGRLLTPEETTAAGRSDPGAFAPTVQYRHQREIETPRIEEGFSAIDRVAFERQHDPDFDQPAVVIWCDGLLWKSRSGQRSPQSPDDVEVPAGVRAAVQRFAASGWPLFGFSWQPELADATRSRDQVAACIARAQELLGLPVTIDYCPHAAGPPVCWCRKPLPGLVVALIQRHRLDASRCLYVGNGTRDASFARRCGLRHIEAELFLRSDPPP